MKKINIDMEKIFCVEKTENHIVLFNLKGINGLNIGDVFFRRNKNNTTEILQDYEYLNKEYLDKIYGTYCKLMESSNAVAKKVEDKLCPLPVHLNIPPSPSDINLSVKTDI